MTKEALERGKVIEKELDDWKAKLNAVDRGDINLQHCTSSERLYIWMTVGGYNAVKAIIRSEIESNIRRLETELAGL